MGKKELSLKQTTIIWNMTYGCNFNCAECFQPFNKDRHPPKQVVLKVINELSKKIHGNCVLKLTGGEIFTMPNFVDEIIPYLIDKTNFRLTSTTNLSASLKTYESFLTQGKNRLDRFSVSWHYQYFTPKEFAEKVIKLRKMMDKLGLAEVLLKINLILIPQNFSKLQIIKKKLKSLKNIKFHFQAFRISFYGRKYYKYNSRERSEIRKLVDDYSPLGYNNKRHFQGRKCSAGINYFVVNPYGDVFTCHEAYELEKNGKYALGNLIDGTFEPLKREIFCPFDYCTVPAVAIKNIVKLNKK